MSYDIQEINTPLLTSPMTIPTTTLVVAPNTEILLPIQIVLYPTYVPTTTANETVSVF